MSSPSFVEKHWSDDAPIDTDSETIGGFDGGRRSYVSVDTEASAEQVSSSEQDEPQTLQVRDRGPASLESQRYYHLVHADDMTPLQQPRYSRHIKGKLSTEKYHASSVNPSGHRESDFDEGVSDEAAEEFGPRGKSSGSSRSRSPSAYHMDPDATVTEYRPFSSYTIQGRKNERSPRLVSSKNSMASTHRLPLRANAPHLRDPYHVDERSPLLQMHGRGSEYQQTFMTPKSVQERDQSHKSTFCQTWFNTVNALIGVGILSMPLVFSQCGWLGGFMLFMLCGGVTNWSGKLLARILRRDPKLQTYVDIGTYALGSGVRVWISVLFCMEMFMVAVALIILFGDSLAVLVYGYRQEPSPAAMILFKVVGFVVAMPTLFLPLSFLSPISLLGLSSILFLFAVLLLDGLMKRSAPGSLWEPASTTWMPKWSGMGLGFGLLMSGYSAHPIIPSLYRDMQDPSKFDRMLNVAYATTAFLYMAVASTGYLMFGDQVSDEVSTDLARTPGMPAALTTACVCLLVINPVTKFGLALRPVQGLFESLLGVSQSMSEQESDMSHPACNERGSNFFQSNSHIQQAAAHSLEVVTHPSLIKRYASMLGPRLCRLILGLVLSGLVLMTAIVFPSLERVMSFLGACLAFSTCILGPFVANMAVFASEQSGLSILVDCVILSVSFLLCILGTISSIRSVD